MENKKFLKFNEPYLRKVDHKKYGSNHIMLDFLISLLPVILVGYYSNGISPYLENHKFIYLIFPLIFLFLGCLFCYLIELLYHLYKKEYEINFVYSIIPGLLLSLILPLNTPIWVLFIGCFFATFIGKIIYGGFGRNVFNPSLIGYVFIMTAFYSVIKDNNNFSDVVSGVTPLSYLDNVINKGVNIDEIISNNYNNICDFCFSLRSGSFAESSSIACVISYLYLIIRGVINYKTTLIYFIIIFIYSYILGLFIGFTNFNFALYNLFSGGVIFGGVFMLTEPITSPRSVYGKYIYSIFCGVITLFLRLLSNLPDGTATAILFMNMLSPLIDNFGAKYRVEKNLLKRCLKFMYLFIIVICIFGYSVVKINSNANVSDENNYEIVSIKQDFDKLKEGNITFVYEIKINEDVVSVYSDTDGNIDEEGIDSNLINDLKEIVYKNRVNKRSNSKDQQLAYISKIESKDGKYIITGRSRGYVNDVEIIVEYYNGKVNTNKVNLNYETELSGGLENSTGTIDDLYNIGKGERVDVVSNVTYTSVALYSARLTIIDYINNHLGGSLEK